MPISASTKPCSKGSSFLNKVRIKTSSKYDGLLAQFYDADHCWRDYKKQASLFCALYKKSERKKIRVLDIGCGSGSHALELAKNGFQVVGIDHSRALLQIAKGKTIRFRRQIHLFQKDFFQMSPTSISAFDCALFLGWSLNIASLYERFSELLKRAAYFLKPGGFFVLDTAIGKTTQALPQQPLHYKVSAGLKGRLIIQELIKVKKKERYLTYDWEIMKNHNSKPERIFFRAKETLKIIRPAELYKKIEENENFEMERKLSDYRLNAPYRLGDKNLILILRKKEVVDDDP